MKKGDGSPVDNSRDEEEKFREYLPPQVFRMDSADRGLGQCAPGSGYTEIRGCQSNGNSASFGCWTNGLTAGNNCWFDGSSPGSGCIFTGSGDT